MKWYFHAVKEQISISPNQTLNQMPNLFIFMVDQIQSEPSNRILKKQKLIIGRREKVDFPDLQLSGIDAKIDTGAYTGAIHCHEVQLTIREGITYVRFRLLDPSHPDYDHKLFELPLLKEKRIKNSFGNSESRYLIKTAMRVHGRTFPVELSLADRSKMEYPVLLGRKAIRGKFIVDVSKINLSGKSA